MTLSVENLTINNANIPLISSVSFTVNNGEVMTLMGPSGCGKSSLLSAIAGHLSPAFTLEGQIHLNNMIMNDLEPDQRQIGFLFQDDLLFPHLNVWENLAFGLPRCITGASRKEKAILTLTQIGLHNIAFHMPNEISGGQRARISLMRTLLAKPKAVLLDEPFSKLDKALRIEFRLFVFEQIKKQNIPALMVTHDDDDIPENGLVLHWPWNNTARGLANA